MLRFLVDESTGKNIALYLAEKGLDTKYVGDIMPSALDELVLAFAEKEKRILITNDKDFGALIFRLKKPSSGVILLRLKIDSLENKQKYINYIIKNLNSKIKSSFIVITENKVRIIKI